MSSIIKKIVCSNTHNMELSLFDLLPKETKEIVNFIEHLMLTLLIELVGTRNAKLRILNKLKWQNFIINKNGLMIIKEKKPLLYNSIQYKFKHSKYRFSLIIYILGEIHRLLLVHGSCSNRELYYKNRILARRQANTDAAIRDVCFLLNKSSSFLGINPASKGLIAGNVRIIVNNGDIIDCNNDQNGGTLLPHVISSIVTIETDAKCVLLVEKDTIFRKLLGLNAISYYNCILLTGKGYPDMNTRYLVHRLSNECQLPVYALFDADPFGIEIMLIYRHGSRAMALNADCLACPQLYWLGVHPTELDMLNIPTLSLQPTDYCRLQKILQRNYLSHGVRNELECMLRIKRKAQIESIAELLMQDYIPNKILRNLLI